MRIFVKFEESKDVETDSKDLDSRTPLLLAAQKGHLEVVQALLKREDVIIDIKDLEWPDAAVIGRQEWPLGGGEGALGPRRLEEGP